MDRLREIPVNNWEDISVSAYILSLSEAKERFAHHIAENESVTTKAIQLLTVFVPFVSASFLYVLGKNSCLFITFLLAIPYSITIIKGFLIIKTHKIQASGSTPEYFITEDIDSYSEALKEKYVYKNLIEMYWYKSNRMVSINSDRMAKYNTVIIWAISSFILTGIYIGLIS